MASFDEFRKKLEDVESPEHSALLKHVRSLVSISRGEMAKNYTTWDEHDMVFRSKKRTDREDQIAKTEGKPTKMIVPLTYSQIVTFVAFSVMSITQNSRFFELEPTGTEDNPLTEPIELILERDLRRNQWNAFLIQFFLDIGRFGIGAAEICYREDYRWMRTNKTETVQGAFEVQQKKETTSFEQIPIFIGNRVYPVSPYRFLPDTRIPLTRYQEGEFCGSEDIFSLSSLEGQPNTFNTDKIPKYTETGYSSRRQISRVDLGPVGTEPRSNPNLGTNTDGNVTHDNSSMVTSGPVVITKMVLDMRPKKVLLGEKDAPMLGDEEHPIRYLCWVANDKTIVRFEEAYYLHGMFPYIFAQYMPDQHMGCSDSLASVCEQITNLVTWKINAHIIAQRNSLDGKLAIDPSGIETKTLSSRSPFIYMKKAAAGLDVNRYIKEISTTDSTMNVMKDVGDLDSLLEKISGFSAQMQGQYSTGRRSATQDRVVAQGAGARGKMTISGIWDTAFEPLGKQLIANNRQEMDAETFQRILGKRDFGTNPETEQPFSVEEIFTLFKADPVSIAMSEDFFVFDGTLPSEKAFLAQSLQEILMQIMSNPEVAIIMGYDAATIKELFNQIYLLRGVTPARLPSGKTADPAMIQALQQLRTPPSPTPSANSGAV